MADWIRRSFGGIGLTQSPPGKHLKRLQEQYLGQVILCIDVSGSMASVEGGRTRLAHAVAGAQRFIAEAVANNYQVGLILWHHGVASSVPLSTDPKATLAALAGAYPSGGNDIQPTLMLGLQQLKDRTGDRVLAIFGDGDLGDQHRAIASARTVAEHGIRIIVRGLGESASALLRQIATETEEAAPTVITAADQIEGGIATMTRSLRSYGLTARP